jgi:hypothetical protein
VPSFFPQVDPASTYPTYTVTHLSHSDSRGMNCIMEHQKDSAVQCWSLDVFCSQRDAADRARAKGFLKLLSGLAEANQYRVMNRKDTFCDDMIIH